MFFPLRCTEGKFGGSVRYRFYDCRLLFGALQDVPVFCSAGRSAHARCRAAAVGAHLVGVTGAVDPSGTNVDWS